MGLIDFPGTSGLAVDRPAVNDNERREPGPSVALPPPRFSEILRLDPARAGLNPKPPAPRRPFPFGPLVSLLLHLLPLLLLLEWPRTVPEVSTPIPIQLVIEEPPPPPPPPKPEEAKPAPKAQSRPPSGRLASDDMAETVSPKPEPPKPEAGKNDPGPPEADRESSVAETQTAMAPPSPPPAPPTESPPAPPRRSAETRTALVAPPKPIQIPLEEQAIGDLPAPAAEPVPAAPAAPPAPPPRPAPLRERTAMHLPRPLGSSWPLPLHQAPANELPHSARFHGAPAMRDEHLALMKALILKQIGVFPLSATSGRHGDTEILLRVLGDGTINSVRIETSSGYSDIDQRIQRMVLAVGRFPPLPAWMGSYMDFSFHMHFPHPLQQ